MFIQLIIPCEPSEASSYSGIRLCSVMSGERPASFATELVFLPAGLAQTRTTNPSPFKHAAVTRWQADALAPRQ